MIYYFTPYSLEKNLGKAYNDYCKLILNDDDWICLLDGDTMFLTPSWGHQLDEIVSKNPNVGLFTCVTNRIGNKAQRQPAMFDITDLTVHRAKAMTLAETQKLTLTPQKTIISGLMMLFKKRTWKEVGRFSETSKGCNFFGNILGVDNDFSLKVLDAKKQIMLMNGVYLLHYYRLCEGKSYKAHLL